MTTLLNLDFVRAFSSTIWIPECAFQFTKHWFILTQQLDLLFFFFPSSQVFHFNDTHSQRQEKSLGHTQLWMNTNTNVVVINHWKDLAALSTRTTGIQLTSITGNFLAVNNWSWCRECNQRNKITNFSDCTCISEHFGWHDAAAIHSACIIQPWLCEGGRRITIWGNSRSGFWTGNT